MNHAEKTILIMNYYGFQKPEAEYCAKTIKQSKLNEIQQTLKNSKEIITA